MTSSRGELVTALHAGPPDPDRGAASGGILEPVLAEIRLGRSWTDEEASLATGIAERVRIPVPTMEDVCRTSTGW